MIYIQPDYLKSDIEEMNKIINSITGNNSFTLNDNELNMISSFYDKKVSKYLEEKKEKKEKEEKDNVSQKNIGDLMGSLLDTYNNDLYNKDMMKDDGMMKDDDKDCKPLDDFISELNRTVENKQNKTPLFMGKDKDGSLII